MSPRKLRIFRDYIESQLGGFLSSGMRSNWVVRSTKYDAARNYFERFFFGNHLADSNSIFVVANFFFERFEFLECSKFNHMQRDCTCACAVACLCPQNSNSNVVVSLMIYDNIYRDM